MIRCVVEDLLLFIRRVGDWLRVGWVGCVDALGVFSLSVLGCWGFLW